MVTKVILVKIFGYLKVLQGPILDQTFGVAVLGNLVPCPCLFKC